MNAWNGLDFFIFLILVMNTILGMTRGATKEIISLMCLSAALIFTIKFTIPLAHFLNQSPLMNDFVTNPVVKNFFEFGIKAGPLTIGLLKEIMYSISLLICFVGVFSLCEAGLNITGFTEVFSFPYAALNRKVGGTLGFTRGYIITLIFLSILMHIYKADNSIGGNFINGSFFTRLFSSQVQTLDNIISSQQPENYQKLYQNQPYSVDQLYQNLGKPQEPFKTPQPQQAPSQPLPQQP